MDDENDDKLKPENFWKCKECGQIVEIDFEVCWNCQYPKPEIVQNPSTDEVLKSESEEPEQLNAENYWRCPKCGETVEMDLTVCWNCEQIVVDEFERPTTAEILNYQGDKKPASIFQTGLLSIAAGILLLAFSGLTPIAEFLGYERIYYGRFLFGIFFIIIGIFLTIVGYIQKK